MSQGFRKIPGDMCTGGLDLNPHVFACGYSGLIFGLFSFKSTLLVIAIIAIVYYGWPLIDKTVKTLSFPSLQTVKDKFASGIPKTGRSGRAEYT